METLFINIIKSSGLIAMFYIAYYLLLRNETFFTGNRWFLLMGLLTSAILPWIVFTTIVWVEPAPMNIDWTKIPMTPVKEEGFEINWYLVLAIAYTAGTVLFLAQFAFDFYNLNRVIKGKTVTHQADHKFIDTAENIAPFSYFNTIVYNSSLYSEQDMTNILEHEKIHSEQFHTVDVLITRVFCVLFWFNPFIWLYKKAILQNLEFIADNEATKKLSDKKAYQFTLLKITTHENCVLLTNHFYQSLIKKRIVMLNKNQSKKWNSLKYALVVPILTAFVFLFQMEIIAKEKPQKTVIEQAKSASKDVEIYKIDKNTTEAELKEKAEEINKNYGVTVRFSKTKRNANNELTAIAVEIKKGKEIAENRIVKSNEPIKSFAIILSTDENGKLTVDFAEDNKSGHLEHKIAISRSLSSTKSNIPDDTDIYIDNEKSDKTEMEKLAPDQIKSVNVIKSSDKNEIHITTKTNSHISSDTEIIIDDKKADRIEMGKLDLNEISTIDISKNPQKVIKIATKKYSNNGSEEEYLIDGKKVDKETFYQTEPKNISRMDVNTNGKKSIRITTSNSINFQHDKNAPVPPAPPAPPVLKFKAPAPPALPPAPKAPKGDPINGDKKAWNAYQKQMEDYQAKMERKQAQMEAYQKQIEKQMEPYQNEMKAYEQKMKVYEEKMKVYQKEMEKYSSDKN